MGDVDLHISSVEGGAKNAGKCGVESGTYVFSSD
jgi:hypothetical protein